MGDLFCGLGNFTLAIASRGAAVVGMEGAATLTARGEENARANGLEELATFLAYDLYADAPGALARLGPVDEAPHRPAARRRDRDLQGAARCRARRRASSTSRAAPSTLARDAGVLVNVKGYRLLAAGVVNMFPHTGHVEPSRFSSCECCGVNLEHG